MWQAVAATIERENSFGSGVVEDGVRVLARQIDAANNLHLFHANGRWGDSGRGLWLSIVGPFG